MDFGMNLLNSLKKGLGSGVHRDTAGSCCFAGQMCTPGKPTWRADQSVACDCSVPTEGSQEPSLPVGIGSVPRGASQLAQKTWGFFTAQVEQRLPQAVVRKVWFFLRSAPEPFRRAGSFPSDCSAQP